MVGGLVMVSFILLMLFSTLLCIVSSSWFGVWVGLELNLIGFIYFVSIGSMVKIWGNKKEGILIYFFVQVLGSLLLLFFIMMIYYYGGGLDYYLSSDLLYYLVFSCLLIKLGIGPFYVWFPYVMSKLSWFSGLVLMTWQKLAPFILCGYFVNFYSLMIIGALLSSVIGSFGGFNEVMLKKLLGFSSVAHSGWMLGLLMMNSFIFYYYYFIYFFLVVVVVSFIGAYDMLSLNELLMVGSNKINWWMLSLLSLGGLPPFLGFFMKWGGILYLIDLSGFLVLVFILMALVSLFYYLRIIYGMMMLSIWVVNYNKTFSLSLSEILLLSLSLGSLIIFPFLSFFN